MALAPDLRLEHFAETAEQFADESVTWLEVKNVRRDITSLIKKQGKRVDSSLMSVEHNEVKSNVLEALMRATDKAPLNSTMSLSSSLCAFGASSRPDWDTGYKSEELEQVTLARDIFGNPFRSVTFEPDWRTSTAVALAKQMYDSRDFSAMPILADALQDAGCDNDDVLNHCRDAAGVHVRGCWVVDLVLGKS
jgi:hypothetical protein